MKHHILTSIRMTVLLTVLTCGLYPLVVYAVAQAAFPQQANGSFIGQGSRLIGQSFASDRYFHSRPSAAGSDGYDPTASGGTNFGPTSKKLRDSIASAVKAYDVHTDVPADAVTSSASGLDPHISPANAYAQAPRVARANGMTLRAVLALVDAHTEPRFLGLFGEPRVNVLELNIGVTEHR